MPPTTITVDVREDIRAGREPFPRIMAAVARLGDDERLRIVAPFEPRPLIAALSARGFTATVTELDDGDFAVLFVPAPTAEPDAFPPPA